MTRTSRRRFLHRSAIAGAGYWTLAGSARGDSRSPNEKLNVAIVGAGGKGNANLNALKSENIVVLCDADEGRSALAREKYPKVPFYSDFRRMFDRAKDIDAVVVSTPDHTHAVISMAAIELGKHVYCEKPLTHSVFEARMLNTAAARHKVATQMGNQGTASDGFRAAVEFVQSGGIGPVREAHVWTNRPIWPQGLERPKPCPPIPRGLNWDAWLGPAMPRPYNPVYLPFLWRGWWDFGTGALGDMACHTANMAFMALKLAFPTSIEAETSEVNSESPPRWSIIRFEFPARDKLPPVKLTWYDGGKLPAAELLQGQKASTSGSLLVGEKGTLYSPNDYGAEFRLLPEEKFLGEKSPSPFLPRSPGHHKEWIEACKGGRPAMSNFAYASRLTETVLLGNVAIRAGEKIHWDFASMRAVGCPDADQYIKPEYRAGWRL